MFVDCLVIVSVTRLVSNDRMVLKNEFEKVRKEVVVAYPDICLEGLQIMKLLIKW
jgi:hypothetical protein